MSSSGSMRDFIRERLTAAADEIFSEFDKTIVQYEEELDRQRKLLEICWKPQLSLQTEDVLQRNVWMGEKVLTDQQFCNQDRRGLKLHRAKPEPQLMKESEESLEPLLLIENHEKQEPHPMKSQQGESEPLPMKVEQVEPEFHQIKEERGELYIILKEKELELQLDTDSCTVSRFSEERDIREPKPSTDQLLIQISSEPEKQNQERISIEDSGSSRDEEQKQNEMGQKNTSDGDYLDSPKLESQKKTKNNEMLSPCKLCGIKLTRKSLISHMRIHTGGRPYLCITCGKSFDRRVYLLQHMRTHTGEKPFPCLTCGKCFSIRQSLTRHIKTHTGEKPFSCITCGKSFSIRKNLSQHIRTHTGERPFTCKTCGKTFRQKPTLSRHMRTHTDEKPYLCVTCGNSFKLKTALSRHRRIHTGEKPFSCMTCGKDFREKKTLTYHMGTHR